jgi:hypothetical protein
MILRSNQGGEQSGTERISLFTEVNACAPGLEDGQPDKPVGKPTVPTCAVARDSKPWKIGVC